MKVCFLKRQKGHTVKVGFDGGEEVLLDLDLCVQKCIHEGDDITEDELSEYIEESQYIRAKSRALWLLDRYQYTERRLYEKLKTAGFSDTASKKAIDRLKELGLIDDNALALRYAENLSRRGVSKRATYQKMLAKGFSRDTVNSALQDTEFDECGQIKEIIKSKYEKKICDGEVEKVYSALIRKGFSYGAVRDALKEYSEELKYSGE